MVKISTHAFKKAFLSSILITSLFPAQQWENVMSSNISAGNTSFNNLVIDNSGNYYVSYYDLSVSKGSVQKFNGSSWAYLGGNPGITTGMATYSSLSVEPQGDVYYSNQASSGMEIRKYTLGGWAQLSNPTSSTVNYQATAVSPSNILYSYSSDGGGTVRKYNNGAWEQVGNAGFAGASTFAEMVIGSDNTIYVCQIASGLKVYKINANATNSDLWTLVGGVNVGTAYSSDNSFSDIALDSNNTPYVAYVSSTSEGRKLNVKKFDGNSWIQIGQPNFSTTVVNHTALTVDGSGTPYVAASVWDSTNPNHSKNSVYQFNPGSGSWSKIGADFISEGAATYNDISIDTANNYLVLTYSQSGTKVKRISLSTLGTSEITDNKDITVYPIPTNGKVHIKSKNKIASVYITNASGQLVMVVNSEQQIDLSEYPTGVYIMNIKMENGTNLVKKVIKSK